MAQVKVENPQLRNFIKQKLGLPRYGNQMFDYLVEEAFVRMQYVLDLSPEELMEDINNLNAALNHIGFVKTNERWMGLQIPSRKEIQFNLDYFQNLINTLPPNEYCTKFMETVIHELLHAMQTDRNTGRNRAQVFNRKVNNRGHAIYEICTEGIATKCTADRSYYEMEENKILVGDGYSQELFAIPLLAATFGVPEKTILKYGVREREKLINACNQNIGDYQKTSNLLFRIENELETIHSIYYPDDNQKQYKNMTNEQKTIEAGNAYRNLIKTCEEAMAERIQNLPGVYDRDAIVRLKYDQKKIMDTVRDENNRYGSYFGNMRQSEESAMFLFDHNFSYFKSSVEILKELGKPYNRHLMAHAPEIIASIKDKTFSACYTYGLKEPENMTMSAVYSAYGFLNDVAHEDYNDFMKWDNTEAFESIYRGRNLTIPERTINPDLVQNAFSMPNCSQKMNDLRIALLANKDKYHSNSRRELSELLSFKNGIPGNFYTQFTSTVPKYDTYGEKISPRQRLQRSFVSQEDQVFLADVMATRFIDKAFRQDGTPIYMENAEERDIQAMLAQTVQKYERPQVISALKDVMLNDSYNRISGEQNRLRMAMLGKKQISDVVMQPLVAELLNERRIIPEKKRALQYAVAVTEQRYPNSGAWRIADTLQRFKENGDIHAVNFTGNLGARDSFSSNFRNQKDMEDMIGIICDSYSSQKYLMPDEGNPLHRMLNEGGPDYFRENIIRAKCYNDYSGIYSNEHVNTMTITPFYDMMQDLAAPFVDEARQARFYEELDRGYEDRKVVRRDEMNEMARKPGIIQKIKGCWEKLKNIFKRKSKDQYYNQVEYYEGGR